MADILEEIRSGFWSESYWMPRNMTWDAFKNNDPNIYKPQLEDMWTPIACMCFVICVIRIVFERFVGQRLGQAYNLRSTVRKASENPLLESAYMINKAPDEQIHSLSKQTDLTTRQVERWFRTRRNQDRTPVLNKFKESSWRGCYYAAMWGYGLYTLWDKEWLFDTSFCWKGWPEHHVSSGVCWYYAIQAGFYMALCLSLFTDTKRKDFVEMIVHHFITLGLLFVSWVVNFTRIGALIMLLHDFADPLVEFAKLAKYAKKETLCTVLFASFMLAWIVSRLTLFPFKIIGGFLFEAPTMIEFSNSFYYSMTALLVVLQVLHIIWFYFIALAAKQVLADGQVKKDTRSDDESLSDGEQSSGNQNGVKSSRNSQYIDLSKNGAGHSVKNGVSSQGLTQRK